MITRLMIELTDRERAALQFLAERELRGLREQARYLIIQSLMTEKSLPAALISNIPTPPTIQTKESGHAAK